MKKIALNENKKKIAAIIQARVGSTRLPNKIFLDLAGKPILYRVIERLQRSKLLEQIVVAIPRGESNDAINRFLKTEFQDVYVFKGEEDDVLDRYYQAAKEVGADVVVRLTSDCPFIDSLIVDEVIEKTLKSKADYGSNVLPRTYPRGFDTEVFTFKTLEKLWKKATQKEDREHVTLYLRKNPSLFKIASVVNSKDYSGYRLTVDEDADYALAKELYKRLVKIRRNFKFTDIIALLQEDRVLAAVNKNVIQRHAQY